MDSSAGVPPSRFAMARPASPEGSVALMCPVMVLRPSLRATPIAAATSSLPSPRPRRSGTRRT